MRVIAIASLLCAVVVFLALLPGCASLPFTKNPSRDFEAFVRDYYDGRFTDKGVREKPYWWLLSQNDSLNALGAGRALAALRKIDTTALPEEDRIDWLQLEAGMKRDIADTVLHPAERNPGQYLNLGDITWIASSKEPLTLKQWSNLLNTLTDAPRVMTMGRAQLHLPPTLWVDLAVNTCRRYESFLNGPLTEKTQSGAPDSLKSKLLSAIRTAQESLSEYRNYIKDTLQAGAENSWAVGVEYYNRLLREYHFLPYTADQMIEAGMKIHAETKAQLAALGKRIDSTKSVAQLIADLKTRHPEPYKITDAYHRQSDRVKKFLIEKNLVTIPGPETLLFVPTPPSIRETYAWGGYGGIEDKDGVHQGRFFVTDIVPEMTPAQVAEKLRVQNNGWVTVIALHEGYAGHHLQNLYSLNNPRPVRAYSGNTYYAEGWALYAESWMGRSGFYQTADDSLGWLQMRLWRTARVIVDPSIHTGRMTYEQAVQFMVDEVGLERSAAEAEVNRYTTWPTQAPSYIIGWLEIENLEKEIKTRLGAKFDEKQFIETVLKAGPLPLDLMKQGVRNMYGY